MFFVIPANVKILGYTPADIQKKKSQVKTINKATKPTKKK